jgi:hypothetical protein
MLFATTRSGGPETMAQGPDPWPNNRVSDQVADNFYKASSDAARCIAADKRPMAQQRGTSFATFSFDETAGANGCIAIVWSDLMALRLEPR